MKLLHALGDALTRSTIIRLLGDDRPERWQLLRGSANPTDEPD
jgi:hypothetical protein